MWIADNKPETVSPTVIAIGWLDIEHPYPTGPVDEAVYRKLIELCKMNHGFYATAGNHTCNLCQFDGVHDYGDVYIPGNGFLYIFPKMITHYINIHWYQPPHAFCQAVLQCPPINSMEYKKAFLSNGGREFMKQLNKI
jgi:hypothetical protein